MLHFRNQDWKDLFSAINILNSDIDPATLGERAISAVKLLISSEMMAFDCFRPDDFSVAWITPTDAISPEDVDVFLEFAHEHPLIEATVVDKRPDAIRVTDLIPKQQFNESGLYNEFYRRIRITDTMAVSLPISSDLTMTNSLYRSGRNFSERDCLILTLLSGHLRSAIINTKKFEFIQQSETRLERTLEKKSCGVCTLNLANQIIYESNFARKLMQKYFVNEKATLGRLPDSIVRWVEQQRGKEAQKEKVSPPPQLLLVEKEHEKLEIRLMYTAHTKEITLLFEETSLPSPKMLGHLGLTKREAEILFWVSAGKTDKDIAEMLFISPRTVNKHTEKIYVKLGVENRTSAMLRAMESLQLH